jgi:hypothetical protein
VPLTDVELIAVRHLYFDMIELRHDGTLEQVFKAPFWAVMPQFRNFVPPKQSFG